jgi:protein-tyrosine phosphatase
MATWVIEGVLARSSRPGYPSESVPIKEVDKWIKQIKAMSIKSIICMLTDDQLGYYGPLPKGLLEHYRKQGFNVEHISITDPVNDQIRGQQELTDNRERIYEAFLKLPKPVLVHCSAGLQRTRFAVEYITERWRKGRSAPAGRIS